MIVEMNDHRRQQEALLAPLDGARADDALQAIEELREIPRGALASHVGGEAIHTLVRSTQRTGRSPSDEVVAEGLLGTARRAGANRRRQLLSTVMLVSHDTASCLLRTPTETRRDEKSSRSYSKRMP